MWKKYCFVPLVVLCTMLCACATNPPTPSPPIVLDASQYDRLHQEYLIDAFHSTVIATSWDAPNQIAPDRLVSFYLIQLAKEENMQPNGEPAQEVEAAVQEHFDVTAEQLRKSEYYDPKTDLYVFTGWGGGGEAVITGAEMRDNRLTIVYDVYGGGTNELSWGGKVTLALLKDNYKYLACRTWKYIENPLQASPATSSVVSRTLQPDLTAAEHLSLLQRGGILQNPWSSADELSPDTILTYMQALAQADLGIPQTAWAQTDDPPVINDFMSADYIEQFAHLYFGVQAPQMRQSDRYNLDKNSYDLRSLNGKYKQRTITAHEASTIDYTQMVIPFTISPRYNGSNEGVLVVEGMPQGNWQYRTLRFV